MNFLKTIVAKKRREVELAMKATPLEEMRKAAANRRDYRSFSGALISPPDDRVNIIAEIKRASPSKGMIRKDADAAEYAKIYEKGGAAAISVLTDTEFFSGSMVDVKAAKNAQGLPVLRKDFIFSEYQVYESAVIGADAILLIVKILEEKALGRLMALAAELGMDALVEVHAGIELNSAANAGAKLIGINNRNLDSFDTDVGRASSMAARLGENMIPVAASGITSRKDIESGLKAGIRNFLVGESIMRAKDSERFLRELIG